MIRRPTPAAPSFGAQVTLETRISFVGVAGIKLAKLTGLIL